MKQNITQKSIAICMIAGISTSLFPSPYVYATPSESGYTTTESGSTMETTSSGAVAESSVATTTATPLTLTEIVTRIQQGDDTLTFKDLQDAFNLDEMKLFDFTANPALALIFEQIVAIHPDIDNWPKVGETSARDFIAQNGIELYRATLDGVRRMTTLAAIPQGTPIYEQVQITFPLVQAYAEDDFVYMDANRQQLAGLTEK